MRSEALQLSSFKQKKRKILSSGAGGRGFTAEIVCSTFHRVILFLGCTTWRGLPSDLSSTCSPSWNGASMVFTSHRRVAFKSNSVVRGTTSPVGGFVQVFRPRFCGMFSNYFSTASRAKTFLSCCTTRAMAIGVTERNRRCVHLIVGVGVKSV